MDYPNGNLLCTWNDFLVYTIKKSGAVISANGCIGECKRSVPDNRWLDKVGTDSEAFTRSSYADWSKNNDNKSWSRIR